MGPACTRCGDPHPPGTATCPTTGTSVDGGPCGTLVDRYRVERLLGTGGNGAVYRARHVVTERWVALKILRRGTVDGASFDPLVREARATTAIGSPRIVSVFDAGMSEAGDAFMAMELLEGCDLRVLAEREGPLPIDRAVDLVAQTLHGLSDAHERGIVHRDVKPANVFVTRDRDGHELVKVLDFGISKVAHSNGVPATLPGQAMGTPGYMAPEQFVNARDADPRADVYAAAVMLYELVAGRRPFEATTYQALFSQVQGRARSLREAAPHAPTALCDIVDRALARDPDGRWPSAMAFAEALRGSSPTSAALPRIEHYAVPSATPTRRDPRR
jgi:serine/threonine protein kinase